MNSASWGTGSTDGSRIGTDGIEAKRQLIGDVSHELDLSNP
jgi:hypothetical protein